MTRNRGVFVWKTDVFCFMRSFLRGVAPHLVFQTFRSEDCSVFPQNLPDLSLRGGRILRPTRQSLTERFAIPKRNMVARDETKPWKEERERGTTQRISCFFVIGLSSCFVLPCFGAGCHTFGLKIATAATRPRNDTKSGRFCLENRRFLFYAVVFARCRPASRLSNVSFRKLLRFPAKPTKLVIARRAHSLRPTRQSLTKRSAIPERTIAKGSGSSPDPNIYYRTYKNRLLRVSAAACFLLTPG